MNKIIIALGISLAASTAAFADSSALDAYQFPAEQGSIALATGATNTQVEQARLGDGSPTFTSDAHHRSPPPLARPTPPPPPRVPPPPLSDT